MKLDDSASTVNDIMKYFYTSQSRDLVVTNPELKFLLKKYEIELIPATARIDSGVVSLEMDGQPSLEMDGKPSLDDETGAKEEPTCGPPVKEAAKRSITSQNGNSYKNNILNMFYFFVCV